MLKVQRDRCLLRITPPVQRGISDRLKSQFPPLFSKAKEDLRRNLGLPAEENPPPLRGEVFLVDGTFLYYKFLRDAGIEVGGISSSPLESVYGKFLALIQQGITPAGDARWQRVVATNRNFSFLRQEFPVFSFKEQDLKSLHLVKEPLIRETLRRVVHEGRCPVETLVPGADQLQINTLLGNLESLGLIKREYVLLCRQTGNQLSMVESLSAIDEASKKGFKCFTCGRPFSDERVDQIVAPTPYGATFAMKNYWLGLCLLEDLIQHVGGDQVLLHVDGDHGVVDLFVNLDHSLSMFEVREEPFRLGSAYAFLSKMEIYNPSTAVLVSLAPFAPEVRTYLEKSTSVPIYLIGSLGEAEEHLASLLDTARREYVKEIMSSFTSMTRVSVDHLILDFFFPGIRRLDQSLKIVALPEEEPEIEALQPQKLPEPETLPPPKAIEEEYKEVLEARSSPREMTPPPVVSPLEEVPTEVIREPAVSKAEARETVSLEETRGKALAKILWEVQQKGVAGRESTLGILLQEVKDLEEGGGAFLVAEEGLTIASSLPPWVDGEKAAAYAVEIVNRASTFLKKASPPALEGTRIFSPSYYLDLSLSSKYILGYVSPIGARVVQSSGGKGSPAEAARALLDEALKIPGITGGYACNAAGEALAQTGKIDPGRWTLAFRELLLLCFPLSRHLKEEESLAGVLAFSGGEKISIMKADAGFLALIGYGFLQPSEVGRLVGLAQSLLKE